MGKKLGWVEMPGEGGIGGVGKDFTKDRLYKYFWQKSWS